MREIVLDPAAVAEFRSAIRYFAKRRPEAIVPFRIDFARTLDRVQADPELYGIHPGTTARYCRFEKFEYGLWYRIIRETIWVIAVAHGKRRLHYWKRRKPPRGI